MRTTQTRSDGLAEISADLAAQPHRVLPTVRNTAVVITMMTMTMMTMDFSTSSYQTETPRCLWGPWTKGPADDHERYSERIQALIARDLLENAPHRLDQQERELAEELVEEAGLDGL